MATLSQFLKKNKTQKPNEFYAPTRSLCDEDGAPLPWEFRHITSKEQTRIREDCSREVPIPGQKGVYRSRVDMNRFVQKIIVASVVFPDLQNVELQNSYGVCTPEDLIYEMVDDPGEYNDLVLFVEKLQGFDVSFDERVDEAKNS